MAAGLSRRGRDADRQGQRRFGAPRVPEDQRSAGKAQHGEIRGWVRSAGDNVHDGRTLLFLVVFRDLKGHSTGPAGQIQEFVLVEDGPGDEIILVEIPVDPVCSGDALGKGRSGGRVDRRHVYFFLAGGVGTEGFKNYLNDIL